jgi:hypothetical protein
MVSARVMETDYLPGYRTFAEGRVDAVLSTLSTGVRHPRDTHFTGVFGPTPFSGINLVEDDFAVGQVTAVYEREDGVVSQCGKREGYDTLLCYAGGLIVGGDGSPGRPFELDEINQVVSAYADADSTLVSTVTDPTVPDEEYERDYLKTHYDGYVEFDDFTAPLIFDRVGACTFEGEDINHDIVGRAVAGVTPYFE